MLLLLRMYVSQQVILIFFKVPPMLSPVTSRRPHFTTFNVDISVTDVTENNRLFDVIPTTCSTLLPPVFSPPVADIQHVLVQQPQCPRRFVMLAISAL